jgi:hypothetical protein
VYPRNDLAPQSGQATAPALIRARALIRSPSSAISSTTNGNNPEKIIPKVDHSTMDRRPHHRKWARAALFTDPRCRLPDTVSSLTGVTLAIHVWVGVVVMPLQRLNAIPLDRAASWVAPTVPLWGVTELRKHGVGGGTTPEDLLEDAAPQVVSGDRIGWKRMFARSARLTSVAICSTVAALCLATASVAAVPVSEDVRTAVVMVDAPNVVGLSWTDALTTLHESDPHTSIVIRRWDPSIDNFDFGSSVAIPEDVDPSLLTVAHQLNGTDFDSTSVTLGLAATVPDLRGTPVNAASQMAVSAGFELGNAPVRGDELIDGQVPEAGTIFDVAGFPVDKIAITLAAATPSQERPSTPPASNNVIVPNVGAPVSNDTGQGGSIIGILVGIIGGALIVFFLLRARRSSRQPTVAAAQLTPISTQMPSATRRLKESQHVDAVAVRRRSLQPTVAIRDGS